MNRTISISVVIRTLNSAATLAAVFEGLKMRLGDEIIVVDSGSTDQTIEIARKAGARVLEIQKSEFTYGRALNMGFSEARNDWVLSLSSHCIPMPVRDDLLHLFREAVQQYPDMFAAVAGPFHMTEWDRILMGGVTFYRGNDLAHGFGFPAGNPNCLYRRSVWELRGFDETLETAEDSDWYFWAVKAGYSIAVVHAATARYASVRPASALFKRGRLDRRFSRSLQDNLPIYFRAVLIQAVRLIAYWVLRKISWSSVTNGIAYKLGTWVESRQEAGGGSSHPS